jgi:hypothetical protein
LWINRQVLFWQTVPYSDFSSVGKTSGHEGICKKGVLGQFEWFVCFGLKLLVVIV